MAYPTTLDTFQTPGATLDAPDHDDLHLELSTAIAAVQAELGTVPSGSFADVAALHDRIFENLAGADGVMVAGGDYAEYSSSPSNISTGTGYFKAWRRVVGRTVHVHVDINFGAGGAITGPPSFALPYTPDFDIVTGSVVYIRFGLAARSGECYAGGDGRVYFLWEANPSGLWEAGTPADAANGNQVAVDIVYRRAVA